MNSYIATTMLHAWCTMRIIIHTKISMCGCHNGTLCATVVLNHFRFACVTFRHMILCNQVLEKIVNFCPFSGLYWLKNYQLSFWTPRKGRSYKMATVCMSVCEYVCHSRPALTTPTIFLIFGMKVGDH